MSKITFRGVELRNGTFAIEEGGPIYRLALIADLSRPVADALGCSDHFYEGDFLREMAGSLKITGTMRIVDFKLDPAGMPQHAIFLGASEMDWEAYNKEGKGEDDPDEARIKVRITTDSEFGPIAAYAKTAGTAKATLKVTLAGDKQMPLTPEAEETATTEESEDDEASLASVAGERSRAKKLKAVDGKTMAESASAASRAKGTVQ